MHGSTCIKIYAKSRLACVVETVVKACRMLSSGVIKPPFCLDEGEASAVDTIQSRRAISIYGWHSREVQRLHVSGHAPGAKGDLC